MRKSSAYTKAEQSAKVPPTDPTKGQAVHFDAEIEEDYTDLEERLDNALLPKPDYPVWLANQIQEAFGWKLEIVQIRRIIEEYDKGRISEFLSWFAYAHKPTDGQIQACLTALRQPRE